MIKQSWREHLQEHFGQLEKKYNASLKPDKNRAVPCPDPRCALFFDSIQALQYHCQDVHCVERITPDPVKRRRRTHQSSPNVKTLPGSIELENPHDLLDEKAPNRHVSGSVGTFSLEPVSAIISVEPAGPQEKSSSVQRYPVSSLCSTANYKKRSPSTASFVSFDNSLSTVDWTPDNAGLDNSTPTSSVCSDLPIDPRLLNESDSYPIVLSP